MRHLSGNAELRNMAGTPLALQCVIEFMFLYDQRNFQLFCGSTAHIWWLFPRNLLGTLLDYECLVSYHIFLYKDLKYYTLLLFHRSVLTDFCC